MIFDTCIFTEMSVVILATTIYHSYEKEKAIVQLGER